MLLTCFPVFWWYLGAPYLCVIGSMWNLLDVKLVCCMNVSTFGAESPIILSLLFDEDFFFFLCKVQSVGISIVLCTGLIIWHIFFYGFDAVCIFIVLKFRFALSPKSLVSSNKYDNFMWFQGCFFPITYWRSCLHWRWLCCICCINWIIRVHWQKCRNCKYVYM